MKSQCICTHVCTYMHSSMYECIHTCMYMYASVHVCTCMHAHTCTLARSHASTRAHTHSHTHKYTHAYAHRSSQAFQLSTQAPPIIHTIRPIAIPHLRYASISVGLCCAYNRSLLPHGRPLLTPTSAYLRYARMSKETYFHGKRDLIVRQKRPVFTLITLAHRSKPTAQAATVPGVQQDWDAHNAGGDLGIVNHLIVAASDGWRFFSSGNMSVYYAYYPVVICAFTAITMSTISL